MTDIEGKMLLGPERTAKKMFMYVNVETVHVDVDHIFIQVSKEGNNFLIVEASLEMMLLVSNLILYPL